MLKQLLNRVKQKKSLVILGVIILLAFFVRVWNIDELFVFKMDQARDIILVQEAYDGGAGELPLLGPRAAKTYLRLGPIFYYFEYVSMWLTGNKSPLSVVWPDFIFSLLTIPLFYYFLRQIFNRKVSLITVVVFASSFFLTQYGRFAWNPNSIPFWSLLFFLGMYKVVTLSLIKSQKPKVKSQNNGKWLLVAVLGYGVSSQLHFTAALAYPMIAGLFGLLCYKLRWWRYISWKYWLGAFAILGVFYVPMLLSELQTDWDNWLQFKYALSGRGEEEFSLYVKMIQSLKLHSEYFYFSLTSFGGGEGKIFIVGYLAIMMGAVLMIWKKIQETGYKLQTNYKKQITKKCEYLEDKNRIIWFALILAWAVVMGLLYTKLSFNVLKPRYWLLEAPLFFIWLAFAMEWLLQKKNKLINTGGYIFIGVLILINLYATRTWYWEVKNQQETQLFSWDLKLKDENKIPYGQLEKVTEYINTEIRVLAEADSKEICFYMTGEYRQVYDYIFENYYKDLKIKRISFGSDTNESCLFLAIDHQGYRERLRIPKKRTDEFVRIDGGNKEIGFITVWQVIRKTQDISTKEQINHKVQITNDEQNKEDANGEIKKDQITEAKEKEFVEVDRSLEAEEEKVKKPKRKERVRWKDVFEGVL